MANSIPDGYGLVEGRSKENARAALKMAEDAGLSDRVVRSVAEGYLVPVSAFRADAVEPEPESGPEPEPKVKVEVETFSGTEPDGQDVPETEPEPVKKKSTKKTPAPKPETK